MNATPAAPLIFATTRNDTPPPPPALHSTREARICESPKCNQPIPEGRRARTCSHNCTRVLRYWEKTPEERRIENAKSNARRFERDLLPKIKSLSKVPAEVPDGHPVARWMVSMVILQRLYCWKTDHACNYAAVRNSLAKKAGGHDALIEIEDEVFEIVTGIHEGMTQ